MPTPLSGCVNKPLSKPTRPAASLLHVPAESVAPFQPTRLDWDRSVAPLIDVVRSAKEQVQCTQWPRR